MGTNYPPDNIAALAPAVWPTHVDQATDQVKEGTTSMKFKSGSNGFDTYLYYEQPGWVACSPNDVFEAVGWFRTDSVAGGSVVALEVDWYTHAGVYISTSTIYSGIPPLANAWYSVRGQAVLAARVTAPSTAAWAQLAWGKLDGAFNAWWTGVGLVPSLHACSAYVDAATTLIAGNWTQIVHWVENYDIGGGFDIGGGAGDDYYCMRTGLYHVDVHLGIGALADGKVYGLAILINGVQQVAAYSNMGVAGGIVIPVSKDLWLNAGVLVTVDGYNGDAVNRNTLSDVYATGWTIHEVR